MAKVITDVWGFAHAIQRQFGCDRETLEQLVERFSENVVIAAERSDAAIAIVNIAGNQIDIDDHHETAGKLLEDPNIDFNRIIDEFRDVDWDSTGYSYETLVSTILEIWDEKECVAIVQRSLQND